VLGGKTVLMKHCAVSLYDFSDAPFTPKEIEAFQEYSSPSDKEADFDFHLPPKSAFGGLGCGS
jgi:hypothetical protein